MGLSLRPGGGRRRQVQLGELLDTGALLLGRATWQLFAGIWPARDDAFSSKMNDIPKLVASRSLEHVDAWQNSSLIKGDLVDEVVRRKADQDLVVAGSDGVVHTLMDTTSSMSIGCWYPARTRPGQPPVRRRGPDDLRLVSAEPAGVAVLSV